MYFEFFTRELFDALIFFVFGTGVLAAVIRLYRDFTRPIEDDKQDTEINPRNQQHKG